MKKILVIEDDHRAADGIGDILKKAGYDVLVCKTHEEIFSLAPNFPADISLIDHDLGAGLEGKRVAEFLKIPSNRAISISTGAFDLSYCESRWYGKKFFDCPEELVTATENLLQMIEAIVKN